MSKKLKIVLVSVFALVLGILVSGLAKIKAQNQNNIDVEATWSQCPDGTGQIVRCATYNCPKGDTNGDGACTIADDEAKLTDLRNDPLCSNPPSGCGEVYYYNQTGSACATRVKDTATCKIADSVTPTFESSTDLCKSLSITPEKGKAPLYVKFVGAASQEAEEYEFDFGDATAPIVQKTDRIIHKYAQAGNYTATLKVKEKDGNWETSDACKAQIVVTDSNTLSSTDNSETDSSEVLPKTGPSILTFILLISLGFAGVYFYKRFRLI